MNGLIAYHKTLEGKHKKELLDLAMNCYRMKGRMSFKEWAEKIKETYSLSDPRNKAIYNAVNNTEGEIMHYPFTGRTEMKYRK